MDRNRVVPADIDHFLNIEKQFETQPKKVKTPAKEKPPVARPPTAVRKAKNRVNLSHPLSFSPVQGHKYWNPSNGVQNLVKGPWITENKPWDHGAGPWNHQRHGHNQNPAFKFNLQGQHYPASPQGQYNPSHQGPHSFQYQKQQQTGGTVSCKTEPGLVKLEPQTSEQKANPASLSKPGDKRESESKHQLDSTVKLESLDQKLSCFHCSELLVDSSRNSVYEHYCQHYQQRLLKENGSTTVCKVCSIKYSKPKRLAIHFGRAHSYIESYIPEAARVPLPPSTDTAKDTGSRTSYSKVMMTVSCFACEETIEFDQKRELYRHYIKHYKNKLSELNPSQDKCDFCQVPMLNKNIVEHISLVHNQVDQFIPESAKYQSICDKKRNFKSTNTTSQEPLEDSNCLPKLEPETVKSRKSESCNFKSTTTTTQILEDNCLPKLEPETVEKDIIERGEDVKGLTCFFCSQYLEDSRRSRVYGHYYSHFKNEIMASNSSQTVCDICSIELASVNDLARHLGVKHDKLEQFLPESARIVKTVPKKENNDQVKIVKPFPKKENDDDVKIVKTSSKMINNEQGKMEKEASEGDVEKENIYLDESSEEESSDEDTNDNSYTPGRRHSTSKRKLRKMNSEIREIECFGCSRFLDSSPRSRLYEHYVNHIEVEKLLESNTSRSTCDKCGKRFVQPRWLARHIGLTHDKVEELIPEHARFRTIQESEIQLQKSSAKVDVKISIVNTKSSHWKGSDEVKVLAEEVDKTEPKDGNESIDDNEKKVFSKEAVKEAKDEHNGSQLEDSDEETDLSFNSKTTKTLAEKGRQIQCHFCSKLVIYPCKSILYRHYLSHLRKQILESCSNDTVCDVCGKECGDLAKHVGLTHGVIEDLLPDQARFRKEKKWENQLKAISAIEKDQQAEVEVESINSSELNSTENGILAIVCYLCSKSVEYKSKSMLYCHYAQHLKHEILKSNSSSSVCDFCNSEFDPGNIFNLARHIGLVHGKVEELIPEYAKAQPKRKEKGIKKDGSYEEGKSNEMVCYHCSETIVYSRREQLYLHYIRHLRKELSNSNSNQEVCDICKKPNPDIARHVGIVHDKVDDFIPDYARISKKKRKSLKIETSKEEESDGDKNLETETHTNLKRKKVAPTGKDTSDVPTAKPVSLLPASGVVNCHICSKDVVYSSKTVLYTHYSKHLENDLLSLNTSPEECEICDRYFSPRELGRHIGVAHNKVEIFLPEEAKVEHAKVQKLPNSKSVRCQTKINLEEMNATVKKKPEQTFFVMGKSSKIKKCFKCAKKFQINYENLRTCVYSHYVRHFKSQLSEYVDRKSCKYCGKSPLRLLRHIAVCHDVLDKLLPKDAIVCKPTTSKSSLTSKHSNLNDDDEDDTANESEPEIEMVFPSESVNEPILEIVNPESEPECKNPDVEKPRSMGEIVLEMIPGKKRKSAWIVSEKYQKQRRNTIESVSTDGDQSEAEGSLQLDIQPNNRRPVPQDYHQPDLCSHFDTQSDIQLNEQHKSSSVSGELREVRGSAMNIIQMSNVKSRSPSPDQVPIAQSTPANSRSNSPEKDVSIVSSRSASSPARVPRRSRSRCLSKDKLSASLTDPTAHFIPARDFTKKDDPTSSSDANDPTLDASNQLNRSCDLIEDFSETSFNTSSSDPLWIKSPQPLSKEKEVGEIVDEIIEAMNVGNLQDLTFSDKSIIINTNHGFNQIIKNIKGEANDLPSENHKTEELETSTEKAEKRGRPRKSTKPPIQFTKPKTKGKDATKLDTSIEYNEAAKKNGRPRKYKRVPMERLKTKPKYRENSTELETSTENSEVVKKMGRPRKSENVSVKTLKAKPKYKDSSTEIDTSTEKKKKSKRGRPRKCQKVPIKKLKTKPKYRDSSTEHSPERSTNGYYRDEDFKPVALFRKIGKSLKTPVKQNKKHEVVEKIKTRDPHGRKTTKNDYKEDKPQLLNDDTACQELKNEIKSVDLTDETVGKNLQDGDEEKKCEW